MREKYLIGRIPSLYFCLVRNKTCQHPACVFVYLQALKHTMSSPYDLASCDEIFMGVLCPTK